MFPAEAHFLSRRLQIHAQEVSRAESKLEQRCIVSIVVAAQCAKFGAYPALFRSARFSLKKSAGDPRRAA